MIHPKLSRRLASVKLTDVIYDKGHSWWWGLVKAAEKSKTWKTLPKKYKDAVLLAENEMTP